MPSGTQLTFKQKDFTSPCKNELLILMALKIAEADWDPFN